jgi:hypothetical protein
VSLDLRWDTAVRNLKMHQDHLLIIRTEDELMNENRLNIISFARNGISSLALSRKKKLPGQAEAWSGRSG